MVVRGAPAIGVTAAYGLALAKIKGENMEEAVEKIRKTRPTAYDLFKAIDFMKSNGFDIHAAERYSQEVSGRCKKIGEYGNALKRSNFTGLKIQMRLHMQLNTFLCVSHRSKGSPPVYNCKGSCVAVC